MIETMPLSRLHRLAEYADWHGWRPRRFWSRLLSRCDHEWAARTEAELLKILDIVDAAVGTAAVDGRLPGRTPLSTVQQILAMRDK